MRRGCRTNFGMRQPVFYNHVSILSQSSHKFLIPKGFHHTALPTLIHSRDGRQAHAVEGVVFYHGVDRHILEIESVTNPDLVVKGIVTDHVAREAGHGGEAVGVLLFVRFSGVF